MKKIITFLMCFCLFINLITINANEDDSYEKKYLPVLCLNNHQSTNYEVLVKDSNIYMGIKNVQRLIQYESILIDQYDKSQVIKYYKYEQNFDYDVVIEITNEYIKTNYGVYDYNGMMILDNGEIYLELYDLLNILKIKTSIMNEKVTITLPKYTIYDFYAKDFLQYGYIKALDLLEPCESTINSAFYDSLTILVNNFDEKLFVPGWGTDALNDELTLKALLSLNQEDKIFYSEDTQEIVDLKLQENGMSELLASGEDLANILSLGETIDSVEELLVQVTNLTQDGKDMLETYQKMINWNGKELDGLIQMKAFAKYGNNISNVMSIADIFVSGYEIYKRANNWGEYALADLDNLRNIDINNYTKGKNIVKHIKQNSKKAYEENKNAMEAGMEEGSKKAFDILLTEALGIIPVAGKMIKITTLAVNFGVSIAKTYENVAKEMDRAQLSAMLNNLIDICSVSRLESLLVYNPYVSKKEDAQSFISLARTNLKANMRAWSYLYYLRSSSDKETKYRIQQAKNNVSNMVAMLELLNIAEDYLYIFDEESTVYCSRDSIKETLYNQLTEDILISIIKNESQLEIKESLYIDMDCDNNKELISVCVDDDNHVSAWYCSSDGLTCIQIEENHDCYPVLFLETLNVNNSVHVVLNFCHVIGNNKCYSIYVLEDKEIKNLISKGFGTVCMNDTGDIILNIESYDGYYDKKIDGFYLHTWKESYLYFDGTKYKEYGAKEISENDFLKFVNSVDIKNDIKNKLLSDKGNYLYEEIKKIDFKYYIRKNGILHIQSNIYYFSGSINYGYYTLHYKDKVIDYNIGERNNGMMDSRFSNLEVIYP